MKLYEINEQIEALLSREVIDIETGEVLDDAGFEELKSLEAERDLIKGAIPLPIVHKQLQPWAMT